MRSEIRDLATPAQFCGPQAHRRVRFPVPKRKSEVSRSRCQQKFQGGSAARVPARTHLRTCCRREGRRWRLWVFLLQPFANGPPRQNSRAKSPPDPSDYGNSHKQHWHGVPPTVRAPKGLPIPCCLSMPARLAAVVVAASRGYCRGPTCRGSPGKSGWRMTSPSERFLGEATRHVGCPCPERLGGSGCRTRLGFHNAWPGVHSDRCSPPLTDRERFDPRARHSRKKAPFPAGRLVGDYHRNREKVAHPAWLIPDCAGRATARQNSSPGFVSASQPAFFSLVARSFPAHSAWCARRCRVARRPVCCSTGRMKG